MPFAICRLSRAPSGGGVRLVLGVLAVAVGALLACAEPDGQPTLDPGDAGTGGVGQAERVLSKAVPLPARAEVVALSDRLAIAASREPGGPEGGELLWLAGQLRERLWRFDRRTTDAREAIELYATVVDQGLGSVRGCRADLRRALLTGELARDPADGHAALYLARRRQQSVAEQSPDQAIEACLDELSRRTALLEAYRPSGEALARLVARGDEEADARRRRPAAMPTGSAAVGSLPPPAIELGPDKRNVVVSPDESQLSADPVELTEVRPFSWDRGGRVVLTLSGVTTYRLGSLPPDPEAQRGHRVYLDVARARIDGVPRSIDSQGLVAGVRLGKRKEGVRVVLDLSRQAYHRVFFLPEPFRIVIDLGTRSPDRPKTAAAVPGARSVRRVALDPGHGGEDDGAVGPTGLREKDVTLDIAHRAAPALAHELGVETMLTRDVDAYVFLEERIARANAFHADLFVSIHCNATEDGRARGVQLFVLDPNREMDAVAQRVAALENSLAGVAGRPFDPKRIETQIAQVAAGLSTGDLAARSVRLAELLRTSTHGSLGQRYGRPSDHGIRTAGFYVLLGAEMPAVLYETAFISNPEDEALLATADFRQKLADSIVNAVRAYRAGR